MESPIFIFSLPRAGSTLLQKVLMGHRDIASVAEPWLLLPIIYAQKESGILTEYEHQTSRVAINDFINNLTEKQNDYNQSLRSFIRDLYSKQCAIGEKYFLDKTPRYHLIIPEILDLFPDAKFIFLFRNPLHIFSSIIQTWGNGGLGSLHPYLIDLQEGITNLSKGYSLCKHKAISICYEDFVKSPSGTLNKICDYLEIEYDQRMLSDFSNQDVKGEMGDPTFQKKRKIEESSLNKWKQTFTNITRIRIANSLINSYDASHLKIQGYNKEILIKELFSTSYSNIPNIKDWINWKKNFLISRYKLNLFFGKETPNRQKNKVLM